MLWLIKKNLAGLEMIIYIRELASIFVKFKNACWSKLSFKTQLKIELLLPISDRRKSLKTNLLVAKRMLQQFFYIQYQVKGQQKISDQGSNEDIKLRCKSKHFCCGLQNNLKPISRMAKFEAVESCKNREIWLDGSVKIFVFHHSIFLRWDRQGKLHFIYVMLDIQGLIQDLNLGGTGSEI